MALCLHIKVWSCVCQLANTGIFIWVYTSYRLSQVDALHFILFDCWFFSWCQNFVWNEHLLFISSHFLHPPPASDDHPTLGHTPFNDWSPCPYVSAIHRLPVVLTCFGFHLDLVLPLQSFGVFTFSSSTSNPVLQLFCSLFSSSLLITPFRIQWSVTNFQSPISNTPFVYPPILSACSFSLVSPLVWSHPGAGNRRNPLSQWSGENRPMAVFFTASKRDAVSYNCTMEILSVYLYIVSVLQLWPIQVGWLFFDKLDVCVALEEEGWHSEKFRMFIKNVFHLNFGVVFVVKQ